MHSFTVLSLAALPLASAWGSLGHETVAYIASHYVQTATKEWAQEILGDTSANYLASVATWADSFRYTAAGKFSAPYHFIDANDSPPSSCDVDFDRDCGTTGCSISAIANYTRRVQSTSISATEVNYALRFLVHFIGDITQPLHDEAYEYGGNDVTVTFNKTKTNLHAIWDTNMPEELRGGYSLTYAQSWANDLVQEISSGDYESQKASWVSGFDINDPQSTALGWASDANQYVCSVVLPNGPTALQSGDLYPTYYNSAISTIELQIAKAGYRLAKWLDAIAENADPSAKKRAVHGSFVPSVDLSGRDLLPIGLKTRAQMAREAVGYSCAGGISGPLPVNVGKSKDITCNCLKQPTSYLRVHRSVVPLWSKQHRVVAAATIGLLRLGVEQMNPRVDQSTGPNYILSKLTALASRLVLAGHSVPEFGEVCWRPAEDRFDDLAGAVALRLELQSFNRAHQSTLHHPKLASAMEPLVSIEEQTTPQSAPVKPVLKSTATTADPLKAAPGSMASTGTQVEKASQLAKELAACKKQLTDDQAWNQNLESVCADQQSTIAILEKQNQEVVKELEVAITAIFANEQRMAELEAVDKVADAGVDQQDQEEKLIDAKAEVHRLDEIREGQLDMIEQLEASLALQRAENARLVDFKSKAGNLQPRNSQQSTKITRLENNVADHEKTIARLTRENSELKLASPPKSSDLQLFHQASRLHTINMPPASHQQPAEILINAAPGAEVVARIRKTQSENAPFRQLPTRPLGLRYPRWSSVSSSLNGSAEDFVAGGSGWG